VLCAGGVLAAAVADGAGSARAGQAGAAMAAAAAVERIAEHASGAWPADDAGWLALLEEAFAAALERIGRRAADQGSPPRDFATTLLVAAASPEACAVLQVGDGAVVAAAEDGTGFNFTLPPRGDYVNETTFVTSDRAIEAAQRHVWRRRVDRLALLTDGLQRLALDIAAGRPFAGFFAPLFGFAARDEDDRAASTDLERFLRSERVASKTDDDVTLLLAARTGT
jgi:hypothetical protein